jgi:SH3-like domain-containing protein
MAVLLAGADARAESRSVGVDSANFRTGPSTSRPILYTADRYYPVEVVRCDVGWCETRDFEGDRAWVAERLLSEQPSVVVNVNRANVRHGPTTRAKVLFRVDWGEALKVTERKDEWLEIEDVEGERGWVFAKLTWGLPDDSANEPEAKREETEKSEAKREETDKSEAKREETDESEAKRGPEAKREETDKSEAKREEKP